MATVTSGNPVTLDAKFGMEGQPSPTGVEFQVEQPDQTVVLFVWGVDPEVTNPAPDYFECALGVLHEVGEYTWKAVGTSGSAVSETIYGTVYVIPSAVDPEQTVPPGPTLGPNVVWITGEDVAACTSFDYGSNPAVFDTVAYEASMALYEISGRQFPGLTRKSARPCRTNCGCWLGGPVSYGMGPWFWTSVPWGFGAGGWAWYNETGDTFGCAPTSVVNLAGYPVREIIEVLIDGVPIPEFDPLTGFRNWRLDKWRYLTRMDLPQPGSSPEVGAVKRFWPSCQDMSLDPGQPGTFEITYDWGVSPPALGRAAAVEIATQLFFACGGQDNCLLPAGVTKVTRQGIEIDRGLLANWADPTKATGLVATDLFLQAYNDGMRRGRRSAIWSPDLQFMARTLGVPGSGGS